MSRCICTFGQQGNKTHVFSFQKLHQQQVKAAAGSARGNDGYFLSNLVRGRTGGMGCLLSTSTKGRARLPGVQPLAQASDETTQPCLAALNPERLREVGGYELLRGGGGGSALR